jgi:predicted nucleic acid-binding protein
VPEAIFMDTSAFGRAFEPGPDQQEMLGLIEARRAVVSLLVIPEARGLVNTKLRRGLALEAAAGLWGQVLYGLELVRKAPIELADYERAQAILVEEPDLVAADALHIAVARGIADAGVRVTFLTADVRQAKAAARLVDEVRLLT